MELRHLRYFVAAAEEQHFSRAADRLCVTRPAVSRMISDLEEELGTQLFERSAHRIKLTAAGTVMLERLRGIFSELTLTLELTKRMGQGKSGVLNIGYGSSTLHQPLFRAAVKQAHDQFPDVVVSLVEGTSIELLMAMRKGTVHVGFTHRTVADQASRPAARSAPPDDDPEFTRLPIETARIAVALPAHHPLATHKTLKLSDLAHERFIVVPFSNASPSHGKLASLCRQAGFEARVVQEVKNAQTQLNLVAMGIGIGLLVTLRNARFPSDVKIIPLQGTTFSTQFELTCLSARQSEPVIAQFIEIVRRLSADGHPPADEPQRISAASAPNQSG